VRHHQERVVPGPRVYRVGAALLGNAPGIEQAVVEIETEAVARQGTGHRDGITAPHLTVRTTLETERDVQKQAYYHKQREGQNGIHQHEGAVHPQVILIHIFWFLMTQRWGFSSNKPKNYEKFALLFCVIDEYLYLCSELDEWWGLISPFFVLKRE
jgi:hypothetical protein